MRENELERRLYRVYRLNRRRNAAWDGSRFYETVTKLLDKWCCPENLKAKVDEQWLEKWCDKYQVQKKRSVDPEITSDDSGTVDETTEDILREYQEDEVYVCFCFQFYWSSLPDKALGTMEDEENVVWLLMAANRSGKHRTRVCVIGKEWRPPCLQHVNMVSQPVVYAGGAGDGKITPDLFAWWFYHEFCPGALAINRKVALVAESSEFLSCSTFISEDTRSKVLWLQDTNRGAQQPGNNVVLTELRVQYAKLLLSSIYVEDRNTAVQSYLSQFTLKEAFPLFHKAWLMIRIETFGRAYKHLVFHQHEFAARISDLRDIEQINGDGRLLLELQWMAHDLGLEVADSDLIKWACTGTVRSTDVFCGNTLMNEMKNGGDSQKIPSAVEAVTHLSKALLWMETEALDPNYLLFVRNMILIAKQAREWIFYTCF